MILLTHKFLKFSFKLSLSHCGSGFISKRNKKNIVLFCQFILEPSFGAKSKPPLPQVDGGRPGVLGDRLCH